MLPAAIAWLIGGNIVASALGTAIGNPLTFPFIWGATLELGRFCSTASDSHEGPPCICGHALAICDFATLWEPILKPMTLGSIPIGAGFALRFYLLRAGRL